MLCAEKYDSSLDGSDSSNVGIRYFENRRTIEKFTKFCYN